MFDFIDGLLGFPGNLFETNQTRAPGCGRSVDTVRQHVMHMVEFALAVTFRCINAVVNDPKLVEHRIDIDTRHDPNPLR